MQDNQFLIPTLSAAFDIATVDDLKALLLLLPTKERPTRKNELTALINDQLSGDKLLALWAKLDSTQQTVIAETLYAPQGVYRPARFDAKYGIAPEIYAENKKSYQKSPTLLCLFLYREGRYGSGSHCIPGDLAQRLLTFVEQPAPASLPSIAELPDYYVWQETRRTWEARKSVAETVTQQFPVHSRVTEHEALIEIGVMLRLVDQDKLAVSEKTLLPGVAVLREVSNNLVGGDFYNAESKQSKIGEPIGPIKAFAWLLLLQTAKLAQLNGKKLALTKSGRTALGKNPAEVLRDIWQRWLKGKTFDEFNRIDIIKGQGGKAKRNFTPLPDRRSVIVDVLQHCPVNAWVSVNDFCRYFRATGHEFEVSKAPWSLYIIDANYGNLGRSGASIWTLLQCRYLSAFLFEYMATLGLLDVAYVKPWEVPVNYEYLWGTDDVDFFSRYDGLVWFRLNPLGAYCLGLTDTYQANAPEITTQLALLPDLQIQVVSGILAIDERLNLEHWAVEEDQQLWQLQPEKFLLALENGRSIDELLAFLQQRGVENLSKELKEFLKDINFRATALKNKGKVLLLECVEIGVTEFLARHDLTKSFCYQIAGTKLLAVNPESEERFRKAANKLGFGLPRF